MPEVFDFEIQCSDKHLGVSTSRSCVQSLVLVSDQPFQSVLLFQQNAILHTILKCMVGGPEAC